LRNAPGQQRQLPTPLGLPVLHASITVETSQFEVESDRRTALSQGPSGIRASNRRRCLVWRVLRHSAPCVRLTPDRCSARRTGCALSGRQPSARSTSIGALLHSLPPGGLAEVEHKLPIWEKALGLEHPDVAASLSNLAMLYCDQGQFAKAESLFKKALMISEHVFGPEHPDLAWSLNSSRISINSKGNMLRKNLFSNGRWRFGRKLLARSILT
jgi:hypothetical protein